MLKFLWIFTTSFTERLRSQALELLEDKTTSGSMPNQKADIASSQWPPAKVAFWLSSEKKFIDHIDHIDQIDL